MDLFLIVGAGFFSVAIAMLALHFLWRSLANLPQPDLEWFETVLKASEQHAVDELLSEPPLDIHSLTPPEEVEVLQLQ